MAAVWAIGVLASERDHPWLHSEDALVGSSAGGESPSHNIYRMFGEAQKKGYRRSRSDGAVKLVASLLQFVARLKEMGRFALISA
jgi:hypothetical protein